MSDTKAAEALVALGLTEYEARCFVALTQLSEGTAKEISTVADVPQSRVYDVAAELHRRGLVDVQESDPRRYFALPVEHALDRLHREYNDTIDAAGEQLRALETRDTENDGVWKIADRPDVRTRIVMCVADADEEVYLLLGDEDLLEPEVIEAIREAHEAGVTVLAEVPSEAIRQRIHEEIPGCQVAITDLPLGAVDGREPGRLMMVDGETILVSALAEGLVPEETEETGIWGKEVGHGLVAWIRPLLEARRNRLSFETATST